MYNNRRKKCNAAAIARVIFASYRNPHYELSQICIQRGMRMSTIVVALGGNALGDNARDQLEKARVAASALVGLVKAGHRLVVTHGNGPQVGMIKLAFEAGPSNMPLTECTAMSQGYIGYHLQQTLQAELQAQGLRIPVVSMVTQVVVDANDAAFSHPSKPIGPFYSEQDAKTLMQNSTHHYIEDAGRGWRRVVASPRPVDICEKDTIKALMDAGQMVIACGGGGVPVAACGDAYEGVEAVIDKDFAAAKLAETVNADLLFILTAVERVCINYRKEDEQTLSAMTADEAERYSKQGHFAPGSMLPKIEAGILFARSGSGRRTVIGALEKAAQALSGESGTVITG